MAFIQNNGVTAKENDVIFRTGKKVETIRTRYTVPADLDDGDVIILGGGFAVESRIARLKAWAGFPALTTADDCDLGFFKLDLDGTTFVAVDADALVDGADLSAGSAVAQDILNLNAALDRDATIGELLSVNVDNMAASGYYLGLTFNTAPTAGGVIDWDIELDNPTAR